MGFTYVLPILRATRCLAPEANGLWRATPQGNLLDKLTQVVQLQTRQFKIEQSC